MKSLTSRITEIETKLDMNSSETPLQMIKRRQDIIMRFFSKPPLSTDEMIEFAKLHGNSMVEVHDNLKIFQSLIEQTDTKKDKKKLEEK